MFRLRHFVSSNIQEAGPPAKSSVLVFDTLLQNSHEVNSSFIETLKDQDFIAC